MFVETLPPFHVFAPGPAGNPNYGGSPDLEPGTITDFKGHSMISEDYTLTATATGSDGKIYSVGTDMRVFRGTYRARNGEVQDATFCFI